MYASSSYLSTCESKPGGGVPLPTSVRNKAGEADRERLVRGAGEAQAGEIGGAPGVKRRALHEQQISAMLQAAQDSNAWAQTRTWARVQGSFMEGRSGFIAKVVMFALISEFECETVTPEEVGARPA